MGLLWPRIWGLGCSANGAAHPQLFGGGKRIKLVKGHTSGMGSEHLGFAWGLYVFFWVLGVMLLLWVRLLLPLPWLVKGRKGKPLKSQPSRALEGNLH